MCVPNKKNCHVIYFGLAHSISGHWNMVHLIIHCTLPYQLFSLCCHQALSLVVVVSSSGSPLYLLDSPTSSDFIL
jgi:hypothetical protein